VTESMQAKATAGPAGPSPRDATSWYSVSMGTSTPARASKGFVQTPVANTTRSASRSPWAVRTPRTRSPWSQSSRTGVPGR